jgi:hypothetical protein
VVPIQGRHHVEYAVTSDERMEERHRDMLGHKEHDSKAGNESSDVRMPEGRTVGSKFGSLHINRAVGAGVDQRGDNIRSRHTNFMRP